MAISQQIVGKHPKYVKQMRFEPFKCLNDLDFTLEIFWRSNIFLLLDILMLFIQAKINVITTKLCRQISLHCTFEKNMHFEQFSCFCELDFLFILGIG